MENGQKRSGERFSVLSVKFMVILDCETPVHDFMVCHNSQVVFSRRFLQDFAIYH